MIRISSISKALIVLTLVLSAGIAYAGSQEYSTVAAGGYDLVSYHEKDGPKKGTGAFVSNHNGENYLFSSEENKNRFEKNPKKYLPEYGGWCAYGAALGKKFVGDPEVWKVVDGKLYLNLNNDIQEKWEAELNSNIAEADKNWGSIKDKPPGEL